VFGASTRNALRASRGGSRLSRARRRGRPETLTRASAPLLVTGAAGPRVLSLDVFDTALVRSCGAPPALYLWLGRRLARRGLLTTSPEVFARLRHRVELAVWEREGGMDAGVTIDDFYRELSGILRLDPDAAEALAAEELALEEEALRPTGQVRELLAAAEAAGMRVVYASDTYFSASFVQRQLEAHGLWPAGARCFSSSDSSASKASGALFRKLASELGAEPSEIVHLGDDLHCDVRAAERAGVRAHLLPDGRLNRFEQLLVDARWETAGLSSALAGASRLARLTHAGEDAHTRALREVTAGVAAPLLIGYVLWLLERARELELERLYFVARDGQVLAELAAILVERLERGLDVRYLYASRRSLNLAGTYDTTAADLEWTFRQSTPPTLDSVLARLDLEPAAAADILRASAQLPEGLGATTPVTPELRAGLERAAREPPFRDAILERASARRGPALDYLRQEGLLEDVRSGVVDLGGVGSQARALHRLITRNGGSAPRLFFLGLDENTDPGRPPPAPDEPWRDETECFVFDEQRGRGLPSFRGLRTAFQMFCGADHGTALGYERRGDRLEPVLAGDENEPLQAWGLATLRETLREVASEVVLDEDLLDVGVSLAPTACAVVWEFIRHPTGEEARAWGAHPLEGGEVTAAAQKPLAGPYTRGAVVKALLDGSILAGRFPGYAWHSWHEGSRAMSAPDLRAIIRTAEGARRWLRESGSPWALRLVAALEPVRRRIR
jgi:FMN phosphatase YigB (HAD superfamily)